MPATYTLVQADVGALIRVAVGYTDDQGTAETSTSAATSAVANVNDAPTGSVTISGTATEDQVLTAANTLADEDVIKVRLRPQLQRLQAQLLTSAMRPRARYPLVEQQQKIKF